MNAVLGVILASEKPNGRILPGDLNELYWSIVAIAVVGFALAKLAVPPIKKGLRDRTAKIEQELGAAEAAQAAALAEAERVRASVGDAEGDAAGHYRGGAGEFIHQRVGFADGGEAEMMKLMYPWSAAGGLGKGMPGATAGWAPGLSVKPQAPLGSNVQFQRPAAPQSGMSQAVNAVKGGVSAIEDVDKLRKMGKGAYDWIRDTIGEAKEIGRAHV